MTGAVSLAAGSPAAAVAAFCEGRLTSEDFQRAIERATLVVQRVPGAGGGPAVAAAGPAGAGWVPLFTSLASLAAWGGECEWASAPGADLLALVPEGYGVVVDPGGPWTAVLPAAALGRGVVVAGSAR